MSRTEGREEAQELPDRATTKGGPRRYCAGNGGLSQNASFLGFPLADAEAAATAINASLRMMVSVTPSIQWENLRRLPRVWPAKLSPPRGAHERMAVHISLASSPDSRLRVSRLSSHARSLSQLSGPDQAHRKTQLEALFVYRLFRRSVLLFWGGRRGIYTGYQKTLNPVYDGLFSLRN